MKKIIFAFATLFTFSSLAATRAIAAAPSTSATPAPHGTWMMGDRTRGLTISNAASGADGTSIGFAHFLNETDSFRWDVGMNLTKPSGRATFGFNVNLGYRVYRFVSGSLKGFTQPGFILGKATGTGSFSDEFFIGFNYRFGAEYFFNPNLSIGGMGGVALNFTQGFNTINLGTATSAIFLTWYW